VLDYAEYFAEFNAGDHAAVVERFCTDDVVFESGSMRRIVHGRQAVIDFLARLHDGVRPCIRPQVVVQNDDYLFAETDIDFHALRDLPDYPQGPLRQGEFLTAKTFVIYYLRNGRICRIKTARWPSDFGVTKP
jgi:hypothetical protein